MVTVSEITEKMVNDSPFLTESIGEGIINLSALARKLQPEIKAVLLKDIKEGAIVMALKRLQPKFSKSRFKAADSLVNKLQDVTVKSNLVEFSFSNSQTLISAIKNLIEKLEDKNDKFLTLSQGIYETAIIINANNKVFIEEIFKNEKVLLITDYISSISIRLSPENVKATGVYYMILKAIAWNNINMIDALSTPQEITMFFHEKDIEKAFRVVNGLSKK